MALIGCSGSFHCPLCDKWQSVTHDPYYQRQCEDFEDEDHKQFYRMMEAHRLDLQWINRCFQEDQKRYYDKCEDEQLMWEETKRTMRRDYTDRKRNS